MLSDTAIADRIARGQKLVYPFSRDRLQPASVDVRLGNTFRVLKGRNLTLDDWYRHQGSYIGEQIDPLAEPEDYLDPMDPGTYDYDTYEITDDQSFYLHPLRFSLGTTIEDYELPADISAHLDGKSSLARLGLMVHITAGFFDPGFSGYGTLELFNVGPRPIRLRPQMKIGQVTYFQLDRPAARPYGHPELGSKYVNQGHAVGSAYHLNGDPAVT